MNVINKRTLLLTLGIILMLASCITIKSKNSNRLTTKKIGKENWTTTNLDVNFYRNGDKIPFVTNCQDWYEAGKMKRPACCYFDFDTSNAAIGLFYNWYAVNDSRKLAPKGWKIPSKKDYLMLIENLGGEEVAFKKLISTSGWKGKQGDNSSGLGILPTGTILGSHYSTDCSFLYKGEYTSYWSSTPVEFDYSNQPKLKAYGFFLTLGMYNTAKIYSNPYKHKGCFVRLIKE